LPLGRKALSGFLHLHSRAVSQDTSQRVIP
jgi:hypothetical protein